MKYIAFAITTIALFFACSPQSQTAVKTSAKALDVTCPIVEAYGPALLAELTKKPVERFEALKRVCDAAQDVSDAILPAIVPVAGASGI